MEGFLLCGKHRSHFSLTEKQEIAPEQEPSELSLECSEPASGETEGTCRYKYRSIGVLM